MIEAIDFYRYHDMSLCENTALCALQLPLETQSTTKKSTLGSPERCRNESHQTRTESLIARTRRRRADTSESSSTANTC